MTITITGDCPSKKNSVAMFQLPNGRWMKAPGKVYARWHRQAIKQLTGIKPPTEQVVIIKLHFYPETKRKGDLTNKAESIMDLLVDGGILEDDNWFVIGAVNLRFVRVDKDNPRVEIEIL